MDPRQELEMLRRLKELEGRATAQSAPAAQTPPSGSGFMQQVGNLAAGGLRGAGSIGATLMSPRDQLESFIARKMGAPELQVPDRREAMDQALQSMGADTDSLAYKGGKIGAEIAGTAGVGGVLAKGGQAMGAAPLLVNSLRGTGFAPAAPGLSGLAGQLAARSAGGAVTGGATAGLVNPEDAGMGAAFGGALPLAMQAAKIAPWGVKQIAGLNTGAGTDALGTAYQAGKAGGSQAKAFVDNLRGNASMTDVLADARANLEAMRRAKSAAYRSNMAAVQADKTVLDMAPIQKTVNDALARFTFKGQARDPQVLKALQEAGEEVNAWSKLDPADFHTPEGLDALKQKVGAILEKQPYEARAVRSAVGDIYSGVKKQIESQAPEYSKAMRDYATASDLIVEIEKSLSLKNGASADTAMRKLQSVMRNNVNTNYGTRTALTGQLEQQGGRELMPALAGQALNNLLPRGVNRATAGGTSMVAGLAAGWPAAVGNAVTSSPRLMGEAAYYGGKADPIIQALRRQLQLAAPVLSAQDY